MPLPKYRSFFQAADKLIKAEDAISKLLDDAKSPTNGNQVDTQAKSTASTAMPPSLDKPDVSSGKNVSTKSTGNTRNVHGNDAKTRGTFASRSGLSTRNRFVPSVAATDDTGSLTNVGDTRPKFNRSHWRARQSGTRRITTANARSASRRDLAGSDRSHKDDNMATELSLPEVSPRVVELSTHTSEFSSCAVIVNGEMFPNIQLKDIITVSDGGVEKCNSKNTVSNSRTGYHSSQNRDANITPEPTESEKHIRPPETCFTGEAQSITDSLGKKVGISILNTAARGHGLKSGSHVLVQLAHVEEQLLEFVELSFEDQYSGRSGMWLVQSALSGMVIFSGQVIECNDLRMRISRLVRNGVDVKSGIMHFGTKVAFRSRSAHIMLMIQVSREMWDCDTDGFCYFEHALSGFLRELFIRWSSENVTHSVSVVLFTRTWFDYDPNIVSKISKSSTENTFGNDGTHLTEKLIVNNLSPTVPTYYPEPSLGEEDLQYLKSDRGGVSAKVHKLASKLAQDRSSIFGGQAISALDLYGDVLDGSRTLSIDDKGRVYEDFYMVVCDHFQPSAASSLAQSWSQYFDVMSSQSEAQAGEEKSTLQLLQSQASLVGSSDWQTLLSLIQLALQRVPQLAGWGADLEWYNTACKLRSRLRKIQQLLDLCDIHLDENGSLPNDPYLLEHSDESCLPNYLLVRLVAEAQCLNRALTYSGQGIPALALQGNFLEAVNLCVDEFSNHNEDRRLKCMGQHMIFVSAGQGFFEVDFPLSQLTKQRVLDAGVGCDVVCVAPPPFHNVPLFVFRNQLGNRGTPSAIGLEGDCDWAHCKYSDQVQETGSDKSSATASAASTAIGLPDCTDSLSSELRHQYSMTTGMQQNPFEQLHTSQSVHEFNKIRSSRSSTALDTLGKKARHPSTIGFAHAPVSQATPVSVKHMSAQAYRSASWADSPRSRQRDVSDDGLHHLSATQEGRRAMNLAPSMATAVRALARDFQSYNMPYWFHVSFTHLETDTSNARLSLHIGTRQASTIPGVFGSTGPVRQSRLPASVSETAADKGLRAALNIWKRDSDLSLTFDSALHPKTIRECRKSIYRNVRRDLTKLFMQKTSGRDVWRASTGNREIALSQLRKTGRYAVSAASQFLPQKQIFDVLAGKLKGDALNLQNLQNDQDNIAPHEFAVSRMASLHMPRLTANGYPMPDALLSWLLVTGRAITEDSLKAHTKAHGKNIKEHDRSSQMAEIDLLAPQRLTHWHPPVFHCRQLLDTRFEMDRASFQRVLIGTSSAQDASVAAANIVPQWIWNNEIESRLEVLRPAPQSNLAQHGLSNPRYTKSGEEFTRNRSSSQHGLNRIRGFGFGGSVLSLSSLVSPHSSSHDSVGSINHSPHGENGSETNQIKLETSHMCKRNVQFPLAQNSSSEKVADTPNVKFIPTLQPSGSHLGIVGYCGHAYYVVEDPLPIARSIEIPNTPDLRSLMPWNRLLLDLKYSKTTQAIYEASRAHELNALAADTSNITKTEMKPHALFQQFQMHDANTFKVRRAIDPRLLSALHQQADKGLPYPSGTSRSHVGSNSPKVLSSADPTLLQRSLLRADSMNPPSQAKSHRIQSIRANWSSSDISGNRSLHTQKLSSRPRRSSLRANAQNGMDSPMFNIGITHEADDDDDSTDSPNSRSDNSMSSHNSAAQTFAHIGPSEKSLLRGNEHHDTVDTTHRIPSAPSPLRSGISLSRKGDIRERLSLPGGAAAKSLVDSRFRKADLSERSYDNQTGIISENEAADSPLLSFARRSSSVRASRLAAVPEFTGNSPSSIEGERSPFSSAIDSGISPADSSPTTCFTTQAASDGVSRPSFVQASSQPLPTSSNATKQNNQSQTASMISNESYNRVPIQYSTRITTPKLMPVMPSDLGSVATGSSPNLKPRRSDISSYSLASRPPSVRRTKNDYHDGHNGNVIHGSDFLTQSAINVSLIRNFSTSRMPPRTRGTNPNLSLSSLAMRYGSTTATALGNSSASHTKPSAILDYLLAAASARFDSAVGFVNTGDARNRAGFINDNRDMYTGKPSLRISAYRPDIAQERQRARKILAEELQVHPEEVELYLLFLIASADINPFRRRRATDWHINANRRRWSHMFPQMAGELVHRKQSKWLRQHMLSHEANNIEAPNRLTRKGSRHTQSTFDSMTGNNAVHEGATNLARNMLAEFGYSMFHDDSIREASIAKNASQNELKSMSSMQTDHTSSESSNVSHADSSTFSPGEYFNMFPPNWKSLCEPAVLPITTDYAASPSELASEFFHRFYTVLRATSANESTSKTPRSRQYSLRHLQASILRLIRRTESSSPATSANTSNNMSTNGGDTAKLPSVSRHSAERIVMSALRDSSIIAHVHSGLVGTYNSQDTRRRTVPEGHMRVIQSMIAQRLAQGFQIVVASELDDSLPNPSETFTFRGSSSYHSQHSLPFSAPAGDTIIQSESVSTQGRTVLTRLLGAVATAPIGMTQSSGFFHSDNTTDTERSGRLVATLSMGHTLHHIFYVAENQSIDVKLYRRHWGWASTLRPPLVSTADFERPSEEIKPLGWSRSPALEAQPTKSMNTGQYPSPQFPQATGAPDQAAAGKASLHGITFDKLNPTYNYTYRAWHLKQTKAIAMSRTFCSAGAGIVGLLFRQSRTSTSTVTHLRPSGASTANIGATNPASVTAAGTSSFDTRRASTNVHEHGKAYTNVSTTFGGLGHSTAPVDGLNADRTHNWNTYDVLASGDTSVNTTHLHCNSVRFRFLPPRDIVRALEYLVKSEQPILEQIALLSTTRSSPAGFSVTKSDTTSRQSPTSRVQASPCDNTENEVQRDVPAKPSVSIEHKDSQATEGTSSHSPGENTDTDLIKIQYIGKVLKRIRTAERNCIVGFGQLLQFIFKDMLMYGAQSWPQIGVECISDKLVESIQTLETQMSHEQGTQSNISTASTLELAASASNSSDRVSTEGDVTAATTSPNNPQDSSSHASEQRAKSQPNNGDLNARSEPGGLKRLTEKERSDAGLLGFPLLTEIVRDGADDLAPAIRGVLSGLKRIIVPQAYTAPGMIRVKADTTGDTSNEQWLYLILDTTYCASRSFCIEIRWLSGVCEGPRARTWANTLRRKAQQLGFVPIRVSDNWDDRSMPLVQRPITLQVSKCMTGQTPYQTPGLEISRKQASASPCAVAYSSLASTLQSASATPRPFTYLVRIFQQPLCACCKITQNIESASLPVVKSIEEHSESSETSDSAKKTTSTLANAPFAPTNMIPNSKVHSLSKNGVWIAPSQLTHNYNALDAQQCSRSDMLPSRAVTAPVPAYGWTHGPNTLCLILETLLVRRFGFVSDKTFALEKRRHGTSLPYAVHPLHSFSSQNTSPIKTPGSLYKGPRVETTAPDTTSFEFRDYMHDMYEQIWLLPFHNSGIGWSRQYIFAGSEFAHYIETRELLKLSRSTKAFDQTDIQSTKHESDAARLDRTALNDVPAGAWAVRFDANGISWICNSHHHSSGILLRERIAHAFHEVYDELNNT